MRLPSAYCATSSGIAVESRRVNTQPDWPCGVRTRLQPSIRGAGFSGVFSGSSLPSSESRFESSTQSAGGGGGLGIGGGGILDSFFFSRFFGSVFFFGVGGISGVRGVDSLRGNSTDRSTSTFSFSFHWAELGHA